MGGGRDWRFTDRELAARLEEARHSGGHGPLRLARARLWANRAARYCLIFLLLAGGACLLAPLLPLQSPIDIDLEQRLAPPLAPWKALRCADRFEPEYWELNALDQKLVELRVGAFAGIQAASWLGRDALGRDLLSRLVWGSRTSFVVALYATLVSLVIGVGYGALAGLSGGRVDNLMMRAVDVLYSLPFVFMVIFVLSALGAPRGVEGRAAASREQVLFVVIGAVWWLTMARVVRGQVLSLRETGFARAARAMGASRLHVLRVHVLPNVLPVVLVYLTLSIPSILLLEAFLSFLGLGVEPPRVSWGRLVVDGVDAFSPLKSSWWLVVFPALAMGAVLLALNTLGDGLRDAFDPRQRRSARLAAADPSPVDPADPASPVGPVGGGGPVGVGR
jgi:oligopeptide transport system permease protein